MIGTTEIIVIAAVALVLFGSTALPKFARSLGQAKRELDKGMKEGAAAADEEAKEEARKISAGETAKKKA